MMRRAPAHHNAVGPAFPAGSAPTLVCPRSPSGPFRMATGFAASWSHPTETVPVLQINIIKKPRSSRIVIQRGFVSPPPVSPGAVAGLRGREGRCSSSACPPSRRTCVCSILPTILLPTALRAASGTPSACSIAARRAVRDVSEAWVGCSSISCATPGTAGKMASNSACAAYLVGEVPTKSLAVHPWPANKTLVSSSGRRGCRIGKIRASKSQFLVSPIHERRHAGPIPDRGWRWSGG